MQRMATRYRPAAGCADIARASCTGDFGGNIVRRGDSVRKRRFGLAGGGDMPSFKFSFVPVSSERSGGFATAAAARTRPLAGATSCWLDARPGNSTPRRVSQSLCTRRVSSAPEGRSVDENGTELRSMMKIDSSDTEAVSSTSGSGPTAAVVGCSGSSAGASGTGRVAAGGTSDTALGDTESGGVLIASWNDGGG